MPRHPTWHALSTNKACFNIAGNPVRILHGISIQTYNSIVANGVVHRVALLSAFLKVIIWVGYRAPILLSRQASEEEPQEANVL